MIFKRTLLPLFFIALTSCSNNIQVIESKVFCFDTMVDIKLFEGDKSSLNEIEGILTTYDKLSDNYNPSNLTNVYSINQTNEEITISGELYNLLKASFDVKNKGATYFNPLCGSLAKKWKNALKKQQILDENTINEELLKMNNSDLLFKENNVVQRVGEAEIDLGGIAKGYALDRVYDYLKENNINKYLINGGLSSILLGEKQSEDKLFSVGINDLNNRFLKVKNTFISTSGTSVQGVKIGDTVYSHIINPLDGSAINNYDAVIVISDSGYYGDALSTSLMMNTIEEIKDIEEEHGVKTIVIKNKNVVYNHPDVEVLKR